MDQKSKKEDVKEPHKTPTLKIKKEKKRKKAFRPPTKSLAFIFWMISIVTFIIGGIGIINVITKLFVGAGPEWRYAVVITPGTHSTKIMTLKLTGARDIQIQEDDNFSVPESFIHNGISGRLEEAERHAEDEISWLYRSSSPVIFVYGDTMKLLSKENKEKHEKYNKNIRTFIKSGRLKIVPKSFKILEDWEEALNGWVTLNYFSGNLTKEKQPIKDKRKIFTSIYPTFGNIDFGQTSLRISYEVPKVTDESKTSDDVKKSIRKITLYGRVYYIYTKSLLCFGLDRLWYMYAAYRLRDVNTLIDDPPKSACLNHHRYSYKEDYVHRYKHYYTSWGISTWEWRSEVRQRTVYDGDCATVSISDLHGLCSRTPTSKKFFGNSRHRWHKYGMRGSCNADQCAKDLIDMLDNCKKYFKDIECPTFKFPKRRYNVTFVVSNEVSSFLYAGRLWNGCSRKEWSNRIHWICSGCNLTWIQQRFGTSRGKYIEHRLCLVITYVYVILTKYINLTDTEWKMMQILKDKKKTAWELGYVATSTNALPTNAQYLLAFSMEGLFIQVIIFTAILTISSATTAFALRYSNTLISRPIRLSS